MAVQKTVMAMPVGPSPRLEYISDFLKFKQWAKEHLKDCPMLAQREDLFVYVNKEILAEAPLDYLEFGVYQGDSIGKWLTINHAPTSRFFGFDTFEGLPEDWWNYKLTMKKGMFDVGGETPRLDDKRVHFVKGLFQDSLPAFLASFTSNSRLLLHLDADLYSSTLYVLTKMDHLIRPGTLLLFDEFNGVNHEFRALMDYLISYRREIKPLAVAGPFYNHVAVEVTK